MRFVWILPIIIYARVKTSVSGFQDHENASSSNNSEPEDIHRNKCILNQNYPFDQYNKEQYNYSQKLSQICDVKKYLIESKETLTSKKTSVDRQDISEIIEASKFLINTKYISNNFENFKTTLNKHFEKIQNIINNEKTLVNAIKSFDKRKNDFLSQWIKFNDQKDEINSYIDDINNIFESIDKSIKICSGNVKSVSDYDEIMSEYNIKYLLDYYWNLINQKTIKLKDACDQNKDIPVLDVSVTNTIVEFNQIRNELNDQMSEIDQKYGGFQKEQAQYQNLLNNIRGNKRVILTSNSPGFIKYCEDTIKMIDRNKNKKEYWNNYIKTIVVNFTKMSAKEKETIEKMITDLNIYTNENIDENKTMTKVKLFAESLPLKIEKLKKDSSVLVPKTEIDLYNIENTVEWIEALRTIHNSNFYENINDYEYLYKGKSVPSGSYTFSRDSSSVSKYIDDINTLTETLNLMVNERTKLYNFASSNMSNIERQGEKLKKYFESLKLDTKSPLTNDTERVNQDISNTVIDVTKLPQNKVNVSFENEQKNIETPNITENSSKIENKRTILTISGVVLGILFIFIVVSGVAFYRKGVNKFNTY